MAFLKELIRIKKNVDKLIKIKHSSLKKNKLKSNKVPINNTM